MKLHVRNSNIKRKRTGFRSRMKTRHGRKIVNRRRALRGSFP
jgi:ribosomal protein L34